MSRQRINSHITKQVIEKAAKRYHNAAQAAQALDIHPSTFRRLCKEVGVNWRGRMRRANEGCRTGVTKSVVGVGVLTVGASMAYIDNCATKECRGKPASSEGLCFGCYAKNKQDK